MTDINDGDGRRCRDCRHCCLTGDCLRKIRYKFSHYNFCNAPEKVWHLCHAISHSILHCTMPIGIGRYAAMRQCQAASTGMLLCNNGHWSCIQAVREPGSCCSTAPMRRCNKCCDAAVMLRCGTDTPPRAGPSGWRCCNGYPREQFLFFFPCATLAPCLLIVPCRLFRVS